MKMIVLDSFGGCIDLLTGTKALGILMVIVKTARFLEAFFLMFFSLVLHAFVERLPVATEAMFAMPVVCAVVIVLQLAFLIIFVVRLFNNNIGNMSRLYVANAVCFGIECIAVAIFLVNFVLDHDFPTETKVGFVVWDTFATVLNLYFILLLRSCMAREDGEAPPVPTKGKDDEDIITIPFSRL
ncbi:hypothetical protein ABMA27_003778 [Loxostege sticticalis]|uniref:MARVEL domain-containing protein n=1 Tax=Loxostege sticticalis TaxID=481309 RepID=A0ABR3HQ80_LOXSC